MFNTREVAILIWMGIFISYAFYTLTKKGDEKYFTGLLESFKRLANHPIMILTFVYIVGLFYLLYEFKIVVGWELIKDYVKLILFGLFPMIFKVSSKYKSVNVFEMAFGLVKFSIVPIFIINEYTFNLFVELILVFVVTMLVLLVTFAEIKPEYRSVKNPLNWVLGIIFLLVVVFAFRNFFVNIDDVKSIVFWEKMFLELLLLLHLPLLLFLQIAMYYEQIFIRVKFKSQLGKNIKSKFSIVWVLFRNCHFNVNNLEKAVNQVTRNRVQSLQELEDIFKETA
ncbi:hypothetical protein [Mesobacillus subterraneus]|uniref:hypothetical protein n=1 Tax=Mesobacillus subterraneus TaxID=285983 RepID=UPI00203DBD7F|nr:hypothetical protein [Mesobacillus subterraneus]MCM3685850.1 hypothetical protein [Mesobacillus subterraneus]